MIQHFQNSLALDNETPSGADNCVRHRTRHAAQSVRSNLGEVADLSLGGARIIASSCPKSPVDVEFYALNKSVTVRAKVAWTRPTGSGFKFELGLEFTKLNRIQREAIESLARGQMHRSLI